MSLSTSASLLEQLRQPDAQDAWARFAKLYTPLLLSWARRLEWRDDDAADLVQEVFKLLLEKLPQFQYDSHRSFRSWLWTLTRNKWRDLRKRPVMRPLRADEDVAAPPDGLPEEAEYRQYLVKRALELMQTDFAPTTWKAFWEHGVLERDAAEVAAELAVSVGAVYAATFRVKDRLRKELAGLLD
jgi:RNA polymerase sigma-70 factor (ECF subfamily)